MSSKRKFSDVDGNGGDGSGPGPLHNKKKQNHKRARRDQNLADADGPDSRIKMGSVNSLKTRVRAIERLFERGKDLPADVKNDLERELAHHKQKIVDLAEEKRRKTMIKKYHMVRFFERKKADRLARQIRRQLDTATDKKEIKTLRADLHTAETDSIYARNFPYLEPYISLYPVTQPGEERSEDASSAAKALRSERPAMWRTIEQAAKKGGRALAEIRERAPAGKPRGESEKEKRMKEQRLEIRESPSRNPFAQMSSRPKQKDKGVSTSESAGSRPDQGRWKPGMAKHTAKSAFVNGGDSDSDSDGGFFEKD